MNLQKIKHVLWAVDSERCARFFCDLFGGDISFTSEHWSEVVIAGSTLGIHGGGDGSVNESGLSFQVDDIHAGVKRIQELGGSITQEAIDRPGEPILLANCTDLDGNAFMLTSLKD